MTRIVTNEDVKKYMPMVNKYLRDSFCKNWTEATIKKGNDDIILGNTGMSICDLRQQLLMEVVIALRNYNPEYKTKEGKSVKESTFIYRHLSFRVGQAAKRMTKKRYGYGVWVGSVNDLYNANNED